MEYAKELTEETGVKITLTHIMAMGYAYCLAKVKRTVGRIRCGNFHAATELGLTVLVNVDGGKDLAAVTCWDTHKKSIKEYAEFLNAKAERMKKGQDEEHKKATGSSKILPTTLLGPLLTIVGWISFACGFSVKALGIDSRMGGHCVLTNVGAIKFQEGIAPFTPWLHAQLMCCIGSV